MTTQTTGLSREKEVLDAKTVEEVLRERVEQLVDYAHILDKYPHDPDIRRGTGYAAVHAAREAVEATFQAAHGGIQDVAPGLRGSQAYSDSREQIEKLLQQVLSDDITLNPTDPLHRLADVLVGRQDPMSIGVAATQSAVALLGLHEFGGVFGAWQVAVLGHDWLTWREHEAFNRRILRDAQRLDRQKAEEAAQAHGLPSLDYLLAGSLGNIAKAAYRAVAEEDDDGTRREAQDIGDDAMREIEETFEEETKQLLLFSTMRAMRAACADALGDRHVAALFWKAFTPPQAAEIIRNLERIEPSDALVDLVALSDRRSSS